MHRLHAIVPIETPLHHYFRGSDGNCIKNFPLKSAYNLNDNNYRTNSNYDLANSNGDSNNKDSMKKQ